MAKTWLRGSSTAGANTVKARDAHHYSGDRQDAALIRQADRNVHNALQQLGVLDNRLGYNVGATKERARLNKALGLYDDDGSALPETPAEKLLREIFGGLEY